MAEVSPAEVIGKPDGTTSTGVDVESLRAAPSEPDDLDDVPTTDAEAEEASLIEKPSDPQEGAMQQVAPAGKEETPAWLAFAVVCILTALTSGASIITRYVRSIPSERQFLPQTAVIMAEVVKAAVCAARILGEHGTLSTSFEGWCELAKSSVPALLYVVQNNSTYLAANYLTATAFQMLFQIKFLFTAVLSVFVLERSFKLHQWGALVVLTIGVLVVQLSDAKIAQKHTSEQIDVPRGVTFSMIAVFSSVLAGVYFEKLLKGGSKLDMWQQNLSLSLISIVIAGGGLLTTGEWLEVQRRGSFLSGYTMMTWMCVVLQAMRGLVVAVVIKYTDSTTKNITSATSTILTALVSVVLFGTPITMLLVVGSAIVNFAVCCYQRT